MTDSPARARERAGRRAGSFVMVRAPYGLTFETFSPIERSEHLRADVALFVGFAAPRRAGAPAEVSREAASREAPLRAWLRLHGFGDHADALEKSGGSVGTLTDVPVPITGWSGFDSLYAWERRPIQGDVYATTYAGAAVRAFFAQGGRKAYFVRVGDPWSKAAWFAEDATTRARLREERIAKLVPSAVPGRAPAPADRTSWRGIEHLFGLPDVSFVLLPDLPDALDATAAMRPLTEPTNAVEEVFVTCAEEVAGAPPEDLMARQVPPPACDPSALLRWAEVLSAAALFLRRHRSEAELVAAVPLLLAEAAGETGRISAQNPLDVFYEARWLRTQRSSLEGTPPALEAFTSAFLQLATPWVKTLGSSRSPGELEPPDGTLAGVLARNALARGTFRSAAGAPVPFVYDLVPEYARSTLLAPVSGKAQTPASLNLLQRVCVLGRAPAGMQLLSDVTTSADESYRAAGASRLVGAVLRAARAMGEDIAFEASNEVTWARVRDRFREQLLELWQMRALRGRTPDEAFQVRCDRSTMSQADIDAGRILVHVQMEVAIAIEAIHVVISLTEGGRVSILTGEAAS